MSDLPVVYSGPSRIRPAASGSVPSVYAIVRSGDSRMTLQHRLLHHAGGSRHARTLTYDEGGRLVESPAPPMFDIRM